MVNAVEQRFTTTKDEVALWQREISFEEILADGSKHVQRHDSLASIQIAVLAVQLAEVHDVQGNIILFPSSFLSYPYYITFPYAFVLSVLNSFVIHSISLDKTAYIINAAPRTMNLGLIE